VSHWTPGSRESSHVDVVPPVDNTDCVSQQNPLAHGGGKAAHAGLHRPAVECVASASHASPSLQPVQPPGVATHDWLTSSVPVHAVRSTAASAGADGEFEQPAASARRARASFTRAS